MHLLKATNYFDKNNRLVTSVSTWSTGEVVLENSTGSIRLDGVKHIAILQAVEAIDPEGDIDIHEIKEVLDALHKAARRQWL